MKKHFIMILMVFLLIGCCACGKNTGASSTGSAIDAVFPANSTFSGITLDGLTAEKAKAAVEEAVAAYVLTVELGETELTYTASDLNLAATDTDYAALLTAVIKQEEVSPELISYDLSDVARHLERKNKMAKVPKSAYLSFDEEEQLFVLNEEVAGTVFNEEAVLRAVETAVTILQPGITVLGTDIFQEPEVVADSEKAKDVLKAANAMLNVSLNYTYATTSKTETIDREMIASWLMVAEDGLLVEIVPANLSAYVSEMAEKHSTSSGTAQFKTTGGSYITVNVASAGQTVDTDALYNDIAECIVNGTSGEREAPYVAKDTDASENFGGTYVEIDLTAQHLWVYSGGQCVVSTDIVSGSVSAGHATPTGVYTIKSRETNRYLEGDGYKSWVNYWMPFNGGIGLHDADGWRSAYGGSIYQYSGSHGCINMPKSAAAATYSHISVGTYVIVYGGMTSVSGGQPSGGAVSTQTNPRADGHSWNGGTVTSEATCTTEGVKTYTCDTCGKSKTETVSVTAHSYSGGTCTVCGAADPNYVPPVDTPPTEIPGSGEVDPGDSGITPDSGDTGSGDSSAVPDSGDTGAESGDDGTVSDSTTPDTVPDSGTAETVPEVTDETTDLT